MDKKEYVKYLLKKLGDVNAIADKIDKIYNPPDIISEGEYIVNLVSYEEIQGVTRKFLGLVFEITDGEFEGRKLYKNIPFNRTVRVKHKVYDGKTFINITL